MNNPVRPVVIEEIPSLAEWIIPLYQNRHPRFTLERMMPILELAIAQEHKSVYWFVRTDNACGLFVKERAPWEPLPTVCDIFVAGRPGVPSAPFEVCRIYTSGLEWAKSMDAVEFRYGTDGLSDLSGIAQRIGYDIVATNYVKKL